MEFKIEYKIIKSFSFKDKVSGLYDKLYDITSEIEKTYPSHKNWFYANFIGNILKNNDGLIVFAKNSENDEISGVAFINKEIYKLCTLFVNPKYRKMGIATKLLQISEKTLGKKPIVTVAEINYPQLKKLFDKNKYILTYKVISYYQKDKVELCFNDFSKTNILGNPNTFFERLETKDEDIIPIYKPKIEYDYQSLFGKVYEKKFNESYKYKS